MKITFRRILGFIGILMAIGFGVFVYGGWQMFGDQIRAIRTLKMVKEHVYTFEYKGDYGFKAFLEQGGAKTDEAVRLLSQYDVFPSVNSAHHLAISGQQ